MILSLTQIANDLGLNLDTLDRWIRQGKIPVNKQGVMGVFNESELKRWVEKHNKGNIQKEYQNKNNLSDFSLLSAFKKGGVFHDIIGKNKDEILRAAVDMIPDFPQKNSVEILRQLIEREKLASTGIGKGVAIPHPRNPINQGLSEPIIVTCFLEDLVDFDAIDHKPVLVLFLLLSPTVENHLNLLSRLSFCLRDSDFIAFIHQKPNLDALLNRIEEIESLPLLNRH